MVEEIYIFFLEKQWSLRLTHLFIISHLNDCSQIWIFVIITINLFRVDEYKNLKYIPVALSKFQSS